MRWFSIKKYIPLIGGEYFVTDGDFIYVAKYHPGNEWIEATECSDCDDEDRVLGKISHFCMPDPIEIED